MQDICILNTGGTFTKVYNPISGALEISENNCIVTTIINSSFKHNNHINIQGIIFKDSLDFTQNDRECLAQTINQCKEDKIIVIHGTDTMHLSASYVAQTCKDKSVIFVGAMRPFSIDPLEATANLALAVGFIQNASVDIYICMQGLIKPHILLKKNRELGIFNVINSM